MGDDVPLIELPASQLLTRFGAGEPTPGSGCAAALMGMLAASLSLAVVKLTLRREDSKRAVAQLELIRDAMERRKDQLTVLFQKDSDAFGPVVALRKARNLENDPAAKAKLTREANAKLGVANEILFDIAEICFALVQDSIWLYQSGYGAVMGDSGAAVSAAIAAITTCIFVINLNVKSSRAAWAIGAKERVDKVYQRLIAIQDEAFALVRQSGDEAAKAVDSLFADAEVRRELGQTVDA